MWYEYWKSMQNRAGRISNTAWKVSKYGVFLGPYFSVFGMQENLDQKKLRIWTLFTQCKYEMVNFDSVTN